MSWRAAVASVITMTPFALERGAGGQIVGNPDGHDLTRLALVDGVGETRSMKSASAVDSGNVFHLDRVAEIAGNRLVERNAVVKQLLEAPDGEIIGIDGVVVGDLLQRSCTRPISRRGTAAGNTSASGVCRKRSTSMRVCSGVALDVEQQRVVGEACQDGIVRVVGIDHLAQAAAGIADEVLYTDRCRATCSMKSGTSSSALDLGLAVLVLAALVFGEGNAALGRIAGLSQIGRQRAADCRR